MSAKHMEPRQESLERPIPFSAPMVRAILEGRKTQTRRVVKPLPSWQVHSVCEPSGAADPWAVWFHYPETVRVGHLRECPYGKPGDRLWVRESFQPLLADGFEGRPNYKNGEGFQIGYCATDGIQEYYDQSTDSAFCSKITPSIFMPRWASRLTLEITEVRVQRVQDISEEDAEAEGVEPGCYECGEIPHHAACLGRNDVYVDSFVRLWDSINAKRGFGWHKNPWVWAPTFKQIPAPAMIDARAAIAEAEGRRHA